MPSTTLRRPWLAGLVAAGTVASLAAIVTAPAVRARSHGPLPRVMASAVYAVGHRLCHQRPERSFSTAGIPWPVCARCTGLYAGAAAGAALAFLGVLRRRHGAIDRPRGVQVYRSALIAAALPTMLSWVTEWAVGAPVSQTIRFGAALPLGGLVAWLVASALSGALE